MKMSSMKIENDNMNLPRQTFVSSNVNIVLCKINVAHNRVLKFGKNID